MRDRAGGYRDWSHWGVAAALALATAAAYADVRAYPLLNYDDVVYVTLNPQVRAGLTWEGLVWAFTEFHVGNWHPITWLSHMLDCQLYGLQAAGPHLTNVALHAANALLLFFLLVRMTDAPGRSAFVAALFALHPLHVESVAWIAERKDLLSTFFGLLSLMAWVRYTRAPSLRTYALVCALLALSLMSKAMLVTAPFLLLLLDLWPLGRLPELRLRALGPLVREKLPLFGLSLASSLVTLRSQGPGITGLPFGARLENAVVAYARYLGKTLLPVDLATLYPLPTSLSGLEVAGATALLVGATLLALAALRSRPYLAVGWLWFVGTLVPVIGLVPVGHQLMADRYTYVPLIGLFVALAWGAHEALERRKGGRAVLGVVALVLVVGCGLGTRAQVRYWRDDLTLFRRALEVTSDNYFAHVSVGGALADAGQYEQALQHLEEAVRIRPGYGAAHSALGQVHLRLGHAESALSEFQRALELPPRQPNAHYYLGVALEGVGRFAAAARSYEEELRVNPEHYHAAGRLAVIRATHPDPAFRDGAEALRLAERACELTQYARARELDVLGAALAEVGRFDEALETALRALELARAEGDAELARSIEPRLLLYSNRRPARLAVP